MSPSCAGVPLPLTMSTTVSLAGGLPVGFGIFGFFFVSVPTASAIFFTSAVGFAKVGALVVVSVVAVVAVAAAPVFPAPLGISAVFVPPLPQAARPTQSPASAGHLRRLWSRITAGTVPSGSKGRGGTLDPAPPRRSAEKIRLPSHCSGLHSREKWRTP